MVLGKLESQKQKNETGSLFVHHYTQFNSNQIKDLNIRPKSIKILVEHRE